MASNKPVLTSFTNHETNSYPVTPDVGKVGNESPTFVEPIFKRKDGIEAMFATQGSQKQKTSPTKRRRSTSLPPAKKLKTANVEVESDSDIKLVGSGPKSNPKVRETRSMVWGRGLNTHPGRTSISGQEVLSGNLIRSLRCFGPNPVAEGSFKFTAEAIFKTKATLTGTSRATCSCNPLTTTTGQEEGKGCLRSLAISCKAVIER